MKGRVAVLRAYGGEFDLRKYPVPEVEPGALLVRLTRALEQSLAFLRRNLRRFPFERIVSHVFPLERISEAFRQADWLQHQGGTSHISRAAISM